VSSPEIMTSQALRLRRGPRVVLSLDRLNTKCQIFGISFFGLNSSDQRRDPVCTLRSIGRSVRKAVHLKEDQAGRPSRAFVALGETVVPADAAGKGSRQACHAVFAVGPGVSRPGGRTVDKIAVENQVWLTCGCDLPPIYVDDQVDAQPTRFNGQDMPELPMSAP